MGYFEKIIKIKEQINSHSAIMSEILLYLLEHPEGHYLELWTMLFKSSCTNGEIEKQQISKLRKYGLLQVDEGTKHYVFNENNIIEVLNGWEQHCKSCKSIEEQYNLNTKDDFLGIYKIYDKQGNIQYIGSSVHCKQRIIEHYTQALIQQSKYYNTMKYKNLRNLILNDNIAIEYEPLNIITIKELRNYEKQLIKKFHPPLNTQWNN